jgi:hypothetical protein
MLYRTLSGFKSCSSAERIKAIALFLVIAPINTVDLSLSARSVNLLVVCVHL